MKKLITLLLAAAAFAFSSESQAQSKKECSVYTLAKPIQKTRGKNAKIKINYQPGKIKILPKQAAKSRGKKGASCLFSMYNYNSQMVHVYVDSVYMGSLQPNRIGVVESISNYSKVYCVSDDQTFAWEEAGNCGCTHIYHLRIKENEGEIYESDR